MTLILYLAFLLHADGGTPPQRRDDTEVVKNLELLELLEETSDYELLEELSVER